MDWRYIGRVVHGVASGYLAGCDTRGRLGGRFAHYGNGWAESHSELCEGGQRNVGVHFRDDKVGCNHSWRDSYSHYRFVGVCCLQSGVVIVLQYARTDNWKLQNFDYDIRVRSDGEEPFCGRRSVAAGRAFCKSGVRIHIQPGADGGRQETDTAGVPEPVRTGPEQVSDSHKLRIHGSAENVISPNFCL